MRRGQLYPFMRKPQRLFGMEVGCPYLCRCRNCMAAKISAALSRQHPRDLFDVKQNGHSLCQKSRMELYIVYLAATDPFTILLSKFYRSEGGNGETSL